MGAWDETGIPPEYRVDEFLKTSAGSVEMNVDGSSTAVDFDYGAPKDKKATITRMLGVVVDGAMTWIKFGGLSALGSGLTIKVFEKNGTTIVHDMLGGETVKDNADWANHVGPDGPLALAAGDDAMPVRWTFKKAVHPLELANQRILRVTVQDNLAGLTKFRLSIQGYLSDTNTVSNL